VAREGNNLRPFLLGMPDFYRIWLKKIAFFILGLDFKNTTFLLGTLIIKQVFFYLTVRTKATHNKPFKQMQALT
jgi:hypothetical protein